jgi:hypothetical protein
MDLVGAYRKACAVVGPQPQGRVQRFARYRTLDRVRPNNRVNLKRSKSDQSCPGPFDHRCGRAISGSARNHITSDMASAPVGMAGDLESARENRQKRHDFLVGVAGFEPATPASRTLMSLDKYQ